MFTRTPHFLSAPVSTSRIIRSKSISPIMTPKGLVGMKLDKTFDVPIAASSNEARQVAIGIDPVQVLKQYENGFFHMADDQVVDYRPNTYTGFLHTPDALSELTARIGFLKSGNAIIPRNRTAQFEHEAFARGGVFDVDVGFRWSAFSPEIDSHFEMVRALCSNQMIFGKGTVMSRSIPLISDWQANMAISNDVLKHIFHTTVTGRLNDMPEERASLADARFLEAEIARRLEEDEKLTKDSAKFLSNLMDKMSFIKEVQLPKSLTTNDVKRIPVPMSVYDAMNIATELSTHHSDNTPSNKLKAFAVSCIFDKKRQSNIASEEIFTTTSTFNDPDRAFWGETVH